MNKLDRLIIIQNKLEMKKESLLDELSSVDAELKEVHKLRHEAEKIVARLEKQQIKLDQLLEDRIPSKKRQSQKEMSVQYSKDDTSLSDEGNHITDQEGQYEEVQE